MRTWERAGETDPSTIRTFQAHQEHGDAGVVLEGVDRLLALLEAHAAVKRDAADAALLQAVVDQVEHGRELREVPAAAHAVGFGQEADHRGRH